MDGISGKSSNNIDNLVNTDRPKRISFFPKDSQNKTVPSNSAPVLTEELFEEASTSIDRRNQSKRRIASGVDAGEARRQAIDSLKGKETQLAKSEAAKATCQYIVSAGGSVQEVAIAVNKLIQNLRCTKSQGIKYAVHFAKELGASPVETGEIVAQLEQRAGTPFQKASTVAGHTVIQSGGTTEDAITVIGTVARNTRKSMREAGLAVGEFVRSTNGTADQAGKAAGEFVARNGGRPIEAGLIAGRVVRLSGGSASDAGIVAGLVAYNASVSAPEVGLVVGSIVKSACGTPREAGVLAGVLLSTKLSDTNITLKDKVNMIRSAVVQCTDNKTERAKITGLVVGEMLASDGYMPTNAGKAAGRIVKSMNANRIHAAAIAGEVVKGAGGAPIDIQQTEAFFLGSD